MSARTARGHGGARPRGAGAARRSRVCSSSSACRRGRAPPPRRAREYRRAAARDDRPFGRRLVPARQRHREDDRRRPDRRPPHPLRCAEAAQRRPRVGRRYRCGARGRPADHPVGAGPRDRRPQLPHRADEHEAPARSRAGPADDRRHRHGRRPAGRLLGLAAGARAQRRAGRVHRRLRAGTGRPRLRDRQRTRRGGERRRPGGLEAGGDGEARRRAGCATSRSRSGWTSVRARSATACPTTSAR